MGLRTLSGSCLVAAGLLALTAAAKPRSPLMLSAGIYRIAAEVANTDASRIRGLMHRRRLPANDGMLFVFDRAQRYCMWMRDTLIPLSVAFLDRQGRIINIEQMQPLTRTGHCAARPASFALEMNAHWFSAKGLGAGTEISGIDKAPPAH